MEEVSVIIADIIYEILIMDLDIWKRTLTPGVPGTKAEADSS